MEYLRKLLRSRHLPASRPKWWERLTIDLGHKGNLNQPLQVGWRACITLSSTIRHNCACDLTSHTSHLPVSLAVSVHSSQAWEECRNALTDPYFEQQRAQHTHTQCLSPQPPRASTGATGIVPWSVENGLGDAAAVVAPECRLSLPPSASVCFFLLPLGSQRHRTLRSKTRTCTADTVLRILRGPTGTRKSVAASSSSATSSSSAHRSPAIMTSHSCACMPRARQLGDVSWAMLVGACCCRSCRMTQRSRQRSSVGVQSTHSLAVRP